MQEFKCLHCWIIFYRHKSKKSKFCSRSCICKFNIEHWKMSPFKKWQTPHNKWEYWKFKHTKESIQKMRDSKKWEKSYLWKWWITKLSFSIRNSFENKKWIQHVFIRDWFKCKNCWDDKWWNLVVHHIKHFSDIIKDNNIKTFIDALSCKELWDTNNWLTLCEKCHRLEHPELSIVWKWKCAVLRNVIK